MEQHHDEEHLAKAELARSLALTTGGDLGTPSLHLAPGLHWTHEWSSGGSLAIGRHEKSDTLPHWVPSQHEKVSRGEVLHQPAGFSGRGAAIFRGIL